MASLLTPAQKQKAESLLDAVFDTYKRDVIIYKTPLATIVYSDPSYNYSYAPEISQQDSQTYTPQSGVLSATITYIKSEDAHKLDFLKADARFVATKSVVKICVREDGKNLLQNTERIEFDNRNYNLLTTFRPRGLFSPNYYDFWLQAVD